MRRKMERRLTKTKIIALGFLVIILIGALLLMLPISSADGTMTDFLTALFTATSTACVTGLVVVDTCTHWSLFGKLIIIILIQIGGLGVITFGMLIAMFLRKKISLKERDLIQESINSLQIAGAVRMVRKIVFGTVIIEGIGAILLAVPFSFDMGIRKGILYGIFHSISAFCNAGFDLMGYKEQYCSLVDYVDDPIVNITLMLLILIGGIGFVVWDDILKNKWNLKKYSLQSKIVFCATLVLVFGGGLLFYLFEDQHLFENLSTSGKIFASLFSSVTARTAGFNTVDTAELSNASRMLTILLMFIGGNPGSTAGGIKTTTIVVILVYIWSNLRGKSGANVFGRRLGDETVKKALMVLGINLFLAFLSSLAIYALQPSLNGEEVLFEVFSAIGTVGMSTGLTRRLSVISRIIIILMMFCGRIGSLTFALTFAEHKATAKVQLPVGEIAIG